MDCAGSVQLDAKENQPSGKGAPILLKCLLMHTNICIFETLYSYGICWLGQYKYLAFCVPHNAENPFKRGLVLLHMLMPVSL